MKREIKLNRRAQEAIDRVAEILRTRSVNNIVFNVLPVVHALDMPMEYNLLMEAIDLPGCETLADKIDLVKFLWEEKDKMRELKERPKDMEDEELPYATDDANYEPDQAQELISNLEYIIACKLELFPNDPHIKQDIEAIRKDIEAIREARRKELFI